MMKRNNRINILTNDSNSLRPRPRSVAFAALSLLIGFSLLAGCTETESNLSSSKPVKIGIQVSPAMATVMVAKDQGFFEAAGANVEIVEFTAGKFALHAFFTGSIDLAVSGEVPVALATLQGNETRVVAQVVKRTVNEVRVVAQRDESSTDPKTYFGSKRRKLATSFGGGPEFFTYSFLKKYGIDSDSVEILSQKPEDMPAALATGSVDAIAIFDPFAFIAERQLGERGVTFSDPSLYSELYVLNVLPETLARNPGQVRSVVRALVDAGRFIEANPEESKRIVEEYTKLDTEVIDAIWKNFDFQPALTNQLLDYWNAQAEWAQESGKLKANTRAPNYRSIIDTSILSELDPESVELDRDR